MQGVSVLRPSRPYYPCISPATVAGPRLRAAGGRRALWARAELNRDRAQGGGPPQQANYPPWQDMRRTYDFAPPPPGPPPPGPPLPPQPPPQKKGIDELTKALIGAAFVVGLGTGVFVDSEVNLQPTSVASTAILDMRTPNSELCLANGYSAMVFDQRIFVSFNP